MHAPLAEDSDVIEAATNLILACYILNHVSEDMASKLSNTLISDQFTIWTNQLCVLAVSVTNLSEI